MGRVTVALETVRRVFRPRRSYRELEGLEEISRAFEAMTDIPETIPQSVESPPPLAAPR